MKQSADTQPCFLDLKKLAAYSCCSVRWLRDRLVHRTHPLPHYRVEGKLLVNRGEFVQDPAVMWSGLDGQTLELKCREKPCWNQLEPKRHDTATPTR